MRLAGVRKERAKGRAPFFVAIVLCALLCAPVRGQESGGSGGGVEAAAPEVGTAAVAVRGQDAPAPGQSLLQELRTGFSEDLPFFGLSLFGIAGGELPNWRNIPIGPFYQLGPGDVILVNTWGDFDKKWQFTVDAQGNVSGDGVDRLSVNGLTFGQLKPALLEALREHHAQALSEDKLKSGAVFMEVKLDEVHGVQVLVTGQVKQPGGYTFDSPTVLLMDALARAGGITSRGSLRAVQVRRGSETRDLDLYDLLVRGELDVSRFLLRQGDVIFVSYRERTVSIDGAVKQPAIYELAKRETLADLVGMAGGFAPRAYQRRVQIRRIDEIRGTVMLDVDLERTRAEKVSLQDGDQVTVAEVTEQRRRDIVRIEGGGVKSPGVYQLDAETAKLDTLLARAGLYEDALLDRCFLIRTGEDYSKEKVVLNVEEKLGMGFRLMPEDRLIINSKFQLAGGDKQVKLSGYVKNPDDYTLAQDLMLYDLLINYGGFEDPDFRAQAYLKRGDIVRVDKETGEKTTLPFDLGAVLRQEDDFPLESEDEVVVYARTRFRDDLFVTIEGQVRIPGRYALKQDMNLGDLLVLGGGLKETAYALEAEVSRIVPGHVPPFQTKLVELAQPEDFKLRHQDVVQIRPIPYWGNPRSVTITGEVKFPGKYVLNEVNERLSQFIERRAGGFSPQAFLEGVQFFRVYGDTVQQVALDLEKAISGDPEHDLILVDGDRIVIPVNNLVVEIKGEVELPQLVQYKPGQKAGYYVGVVGGYTERANARAAYIVRANGLVRKASRRLWFDPAVPPGSSLVVPARRAGRPLWRNPYLIGALVGGLASGLGVHYGM